MRVMVVLSGGIDSAVLLYHLKQQGHEVRSLCVDYGQRHHTEVTCAAALAVAAQTDHQTVTVPGLADIWRGTALINDKVAPSVSTWFVPNRNMILLSIAIGHALASGFDAVAYGAHRNDVYPDSREEFAQAMDEAARVCDWKGVRLLRPFMDKSKSEIIALGDNLGVPWDLTWSCYTPGPPCLECAACIERQEAFEDARVVDPLVATAARRTGVTSA